MTELRAARDGFIESAPHYNAIFEAMEDDSITEPLRGLIELSSLPLRDMETDFAIDSTGFGTSTFFRYYSRPPRHGYNHGYNRRFLAPFAEQQLRNPLRNQNAGAGTRTRTGVSPKDFKSFKVAKNPLSSSSLTTALP